MQILRKHINDSFASKKTIMNFYRYQTNTVIAMFDTMLSIQPKESGGGASESRESVVTRLSKDMLSKLPKNYDPFEVKER